MSAGEVKRGDIWWVSLDPTQGSEIRKTGPCLVLASDTLNRLRKTVVVVPMSTAARAHLPITVPITCEGRPAVAIIDQIRAVGKHRPRTRIESVSDQDMSVIGETVSAILLL